jgi:hypothetical protein
LVRETGIADEVMMTVNLAFRSKTDASLIVFASRKVYATLLRIFDYGQRKRMIRMGVYRRCDPNDLDFIGGVDRNDTRDLRTPFGDRARLVYRKRLQFSNCFKKPRNAPPLISTPRRAIAVRPETIDTGVEITNAHGQAITSSTRAR